MTDTPSLLLTATALVYFAAALPLLFAPAEVLGTPDPAADPLAPVLAQLLGTALFGFAMLNWLQRRSTIGGIYGRPLIIADLAHTMSAMLALGRFGLGQPFEPLALSALVAYAALAVAFGLKVFTTPASVAEVQ